MTKHRSFGSLAEALRRRGASVEQTSVAITRRAALIADAVVATTTPVLTGRARSSWTASVGVPVEADRGDMRNARIDALTASTIARRQGMAAIFGWVPSAGSIFITNTVPYIRKLEHGYSPKGQDMAATAVAVAAASLHDIPLLGGTVTTSKTVI